MTWGASTRDDEGQGEHDGKDADDGPRALTYPCPAVAATDAAEVPGDQPQRRGYRGRECKEPRSASSDGSEGWAHSHTSSLSHIPLAGNGSVRRTWLFGLFAVLILLSAPSSAAASSVVRLANGDDEQRVFLNGQVVATAGYGERREVELGALDPSDRVTLEVFNGPRGYTWGIDFLRDGASVYQDCAGRTGTQGANDNDLDHTNQVVHTVTLDGNGRLLGVTDAVQRQEPSDCSGIFSLSFVGLGDSVAAGEGIAYGWRWSSADNRWVGGTEEAQWDERFVTSFCHQTPQAYPRVAATALDARLLHLACTGAKTDNGVLKNRVENGRVESPAQLGGLESGYDTPNPLYDVAKPDVLSLSLGANDVNFKGIVQGCALSRCSTEERQLDEPLREQRAGLERVLHEVVRRGDVAGKRPLTILTEYFDPFPAQWSDSCPDLDLPVPGLAITRAEMTFLRKGLRRLNDNIRSALDEVGFGEGMPAPTFEPFCSSSPDAFGPSIFVPGSDFGSQAPFHPTESGQRKIGEALATFVRRRVLVPAGDNVLVNGSAGAQLVFDRVLSPGALTVLREPEFAGKLPAAGSFAKETGYEIVSSASHVGAIKVSLPAPRSLSLFHYVGGVWRKVSSTFANGRVTGEVTSLSPFALGEEVSPVRARFTHGSPDVAPATLAFASASSVEDGSPIVSHQWDFGDGTTGSGASLDHTFKQSGRYRVTLRVTASNGAVDETVEEITITNRPPRAVLDGPSGGTSGVELSFSSGRSTDPNGTITEAAWDFGDGTGPVGGREVRHTFSRPGTYTVTLQISDDEGEPNAAVHAVTITEPGHGSGPSPPSSPPVIVPPSSSQPSFADSPIRPVGRVAVSRSGIVRIRLACLRRGESCSGRLTLRDGRPRARSKLVGSARLGIGEGRTGTVRVRLTRAARAALRRRVLPVSVAVRLDGFPQPALDARLKLPRTPRGRRR